MRSGTATSLITLRILRRVWKPALVALFLLLVGWYVVGERPEKDAIVPKGGFVPDEAAALGVARVVLGKALGERGLAEQEPLRARLLVNSVWTIKGAKDIELILNKRDGRVLSLKRVRNPKPNPDE